MTFAQRRSRPTTHLSERIPVVKRRVTLHSKFSHPTPRRSAAPFSPSPARERKTSQTRILTFSEITEPATNLRPAFENHSTKSSLCVQMHMLSLYNATEHNFQPTRCMPCACRKSVNYRVHINICSMEHVGWVVGGG